MEYCMGREGWMKVLRSSVGHCRNKNDSSPLSCSAAYLFPFEALFFHFLKRKKKSHLRCGFVLFCFSGGWGRLHHSPSPRAGWVSLHRRALRYDLLGQTAYSTLTSDINQGVHSQLLVFHTHTHTHKKVSSASASLTGCWFHERSDESIKSPKCRGACLTHTSI